jgi:predicted ferric reductase
LVYCAPDSFSALLSLAFLGPHKAALIPDPWTSFRVVDLLVPAASTWKPLAVALGVVPMYGLVTATGTFYVRRFIGNKTWRALHYTTFATFFLALLHGVTAGNDTSLTYIKLLYATSGLIVSLLTVYRIASAPDAGDTRRTARAAS